MTVDRARCACAAASVFALAAAIGSLLPIRATAQATAPASDAALTAALRDDLVTYLKARKTDEHVSAASLTVSLQGAPAFLNLAAGTTEYGGSRPLPAHSLWQIGSNTKAFTAATILQLEAERALSIDDTVGKWLPQYPAWRAISIKHLLDMTSGIATYDDVPAMLKQYAAAPQTPIPLTRLIAFAYGTMLQSGYHYTNTGYLLAQLIAEKAGHAGYGDQLEKRFFQPLALGDVYYNTNFNPPSLNQRMPAGYFFNNTVGPLAPLLAKDVRPMTVSWMQGAGGIVATTEAVTTWARALFGGRVLAPAQQAQLESVVSMKTGKPIASTGPSDTRAFGLGVAQATSPKFGKIWFYEGETLGYRVLYMYVLKSGAIVTIGLNSAPSKDHIGELFEAVYATLQRAGRV